MAYFYKHQIDPAEITMTVIRRIAEDAHSIIVKLRYLSDPSSRAGRLATIARLRHEHSDLCRELGALHRNMGLGD